MLTYEEVEIGDQIVNDTATLMGQTANPIIYEVVGKDSVGNTRKQSVDPMIFVDWPTRSMEPFRKIKTAELKEYSKVFTEKEIEEFTAEELQQG